MKHKNKQNQPVVIEVRILNYPCREVLTGALVFLGLT